MKFLQALIVLFWTFQATAAPMTVDDLVGIWKDDNVYRSLPLGEEFGLSFKDNGDAVVLGTEGLLICPKDRIKVLDNVFHISCLLDEKREIIRVVVTGWIQDDKHFLFGFQYWLQDQDRILNNSGYDDPDKYQIYGGLPTSLVRDVNGK